MIVKVEGLVCVCVHGIGIVCNEGQLPPNSGLQEDLLSTGPLCRYAEDLLPMLKIMAGANADK